ncbi:hypothetical protein SAMN05444364_12136 [Prevotella scopos JCM 17725]|uniref:Uncharacterized protein n=1 Tax=Prevotella scopos JCM 17725 TaxID=1236518 RepID=A0AAX2F5C6_9BACT|nr:hypothetical protein SAMN05444364_12136 [Prevotella scopos JCM 17725]
MAKMLAYFFKIEMFKAAITRIVKKNHYQHDSLTTRFADVYNSLYSR